MPKPPRMVVDGHINCTRCGLWLPADTDYFQRSRKSRSGWRQHCKVCRSVTASHAPAVDRCVVCNTPISSFDHPRVRCYRHEAEHQEAWVEESRRKVLLRKRKRKRAA